MKQDILKLNSGFFPIGTANWRDIMVDIVAGSAYPMDINYEIDENGCVNKESIASMNVVKSFQEWENLPVREFDEYARSASRVYRLPPIVVCSKFDRIIFKKVVFPTKANIWKRDNYTCFIPSTNILTPKGEIKISEIKKNDLVINSHGRFKVLNIFKKNIDEKILRIKIHCQSDLFVTKEHHILSMRNRGIMTKDKLSALSTNDFNYVAASNLQKGDLVLSPILTKEAYSNTNNAVIDLGKYLSPKRNRYSIQNNVIRTYHNKIIDRYVTLDKELAFLLGLYAAEGNIQQQNSIIFSLHKNEEELQNKIISYFAKKQIISRIVDRHQSLGVSVMVHNSVWADMFSSLIPGNCYTKRINRDVLNFSEDLLLEVLRGYLSGDGYLLHKKGINRTTVETTSEDLKNDMKFISNTLGIFPGVGEHRRKNRAKSYRLDYTAEDNIKLWNHDVHYRKSNKKYVVKLWGNDYLLTRITDINEVLYKGDVYDLEIDTFHQYVANGILVHNCQYSNKKLTREELSVDHIIPSSRGGENTWENLVTCDKELNTWKSDRTPKECGLKLLSKPCKPRNGMVFSFIRDEWKMFVDGGKHN